MSLARPLLLATLCLLLAGCGGFKESGLNPRNWFGQSKPKETIVLPKEEQDTRGLVDTVLSLEVEPVPGGAIVRARGQTPTQGWWQAELVPMPVDDRGTLVFEFRLLPPVTETRTSTPQSRQIDVAIFLSNIKLEPVREIVVQGSSNARSARR
ncbi:MAG: hypothetical protein NTW20_14700 [Rhodobacterales bacterium]|nr:hypothetical protein [Rhodobacterales bacterium]